MKLRSTFLAFAALLLVGSIASATPAANPTGVEGVSREAIFSAPAAEDCADANLPSFAPAATEKAAVVCGGCSDTLCQGKQRGAFCRSFGGQTYTCQFAVYTCSIKDCQCWTGPLP